MYNDTLIGFDQSGKRKGSDRDVEDLIVELLANHTIG
jgi:hypothetical protein